MFKGGDRDPAAAARRQSDVHPNRRETEDGQDGRRLGPEVEKCTAVSKHSSDVLHSLSACQFHSLMLVPFVSSSISVMSRPLCSTITLAINLYPKALTDNDNNRGGINTSLRRRTIFTVAVNDA